MRFHRAVFASLLALGVAASAADAQSFGKGRAPGGEGTSPFGSGFGLGIGLPALLLPPPPEAGPTDDPPPRRRVVNRPPADAAPRHARPPRAAKDPAPPRPTLPLKAAAPRPTILLKGEPTLPPTRLALPERARLPGAENRYRGGEVLVETRDGTPPAAIAATARRHRLVEGEAARIDLLGATLRVWRIADGRTPAAVIAELAREGALARIQPHYLFLAADEPALATAIPQYALDKMKVAAASAEGGGPPVRVAVIDTAVDETHPDLKGAVEARFDGLGGKTVSRDHGTAMAGGIAANGRLRGVDPRVKLLSARAFDSDGVGGALGSTLSILKCLDWAVASKARVVNMSFAGPDDPILRDALAAAVQRGVALVSAAGNLGPTAPPQYPGADAHVIAATATDSNDKRYAGANVGAYIAVSAPGVDVMLPAPGGGYALETGTSVSSALVAGVIALMLEGRPDLKPDDVRARLSASARPLGARNEFGAGLVDAGQAASRRAGD